MGIGRTTVNLISMLSALANVALNYAMIFGHWGFEMGVAGAAHATLISGGVVCRSAGLFWRDPVFQAMGLVQG